MRMTTILRQLITVVGLLSFANLAGAQAYPSKPIRFIVPYPPGAVTDVVARVVGQAMSESMSQVVIIENKPGANGIIGTEALANSAPDGYTISFGGPSTHVVGPIVQKVPYDPVKDFAPIGLMGRMTLLLVVHPSIPAQSVADLIRWLKDNPGKANFGSWGNVSPAHLGGELFKSMTGVDMLHVPYKGGALAQTELMTGHLSLLFSDVTVIPHVRSGKVRAVAVTGARRSSLFPDLPTVAETLPGFEVGSWFAVFARSGTPQAVVNRLSAELSKAVSGDAVTRRLLSLSLEPAISSPEEVAALMRSERERWTKVISEAKIKLE